MSDPTPTPTPTPAPADKNSYVTYSSLRRLRRLTLVSLGLNCFIIFLILLGAIIHHHRQKDMAGGPGRGGYAEAGPMGGYGGYGPHFRHFGRGFGPGQGWDGRGGFGPGQDGGCPMCGGSEQRGPMPGGPGPGGFEPGGFGGFGGRGPGNFQHGFGGPGGGGFFGHGFAGQGGAPDPDKMADGVLNMLSGMLTLTDDQKAKLKPIIEQQVTQVQKQMETQREALQKQMADAVAQIKPILNADQQKQLDALPIPGLKSPGDATK